MPEEATSEQGQHVLTYNPIKQLQLPPYFPFISFIFMTRWPKAEGERRKKQSGNILVMAAWRAFPSSFSASEAKTGRRENGSGLSIMRNGQNLIIKTRIQTNYVDDSESEKTKRRTKKNVFCLWTKACSFGCARAFSPFGGCVSCPLRVLVLVRARIRDSNDISKLTVCLSRRRAYITFMSLCAIP